ncbi:DUF6407 family protein [Evansella sp. AB-P1]|uniref:DUF6407 family protein n=1 Tax=Evansella sp. AB-P1 TaxID=3037653 RepID=UPI00241EDC49|nr:DUF6407 family protein [Evansella sp. AB-P1]MDG5785973.1 DUF6407 family protein [Evansella sp. AB-P1]
MNLQDFVNETINEIENFDTKNEECIKEVVRKAIVFYKLHSYEEIEETDEGTICLIYLHSIIEENLLSKIVAFAIDSDVHLDVEGLYQGKVIRNF